VPVRQEHQQVITLAVARLASCFEHPVYFRLGKKIPLAAIYCKFAHVESR